MTLNQFKFLLQGSLLDAEQRKVNILYNENRVEAIAVRIENNNLAQLQQATAIILQIPQAGTAINISLQSTQFPRRTVNKEKLVNYYLYSIVEQEQQPVMAVTPTPSGQINTEEYFTDVIILPSTEVGVFQGSNYDVLLNNSMNNRLSSYVQISDRAERSGSSANPINLPSILQDNAILASIQDSNYTNTGWVNGRYSGTSTTKLTFGNIDPAVTGKSFEGSIYSSDVSNNIIASQSDTDRVYIPLLHTSTTDYPEYSIRGINYTMDTPVPVGASTFTITGPLSAGDPGITVGDLLTVFNSPEILKVNSIARVASINNIKYRLEVTRGWNDTQQIEYTLSINPRVTKPVQIFEIDRSRLLNLNKSKVYVKDNETILFVDKLGQVVSSSQA